MASLYLAWPAVADSAAAVDSSSDTLSECVDEKLRNYQSDEAPAPEGPDPCEGRTGVLADCVVLKLRRQRDEIIVASPEESDPCFGRVGCSSAAVSADLRRLYIEHLGSVPGDAVGRAAAEFLRTSSVNIAVVNLEAKMVPGVWGIYDAALDEVEFHNRLFKPLWAKIEDSRLPPEAEGVVEHTTPGLAHELRHARMDHELGFEEPGFRETESLAHADMALSLWARLEREPDYEGMGTFNGILLSTAGFPAPAAKWWKEPLKTADLERLFEYATVAKSLMGEELTERTLSDWFLVRSLAGGLAGLEANIAWFQGPTVSAFEPQGDLFAERAKAVEQQIEDMGYCLELEDDPDGRLYLERLIRRLERFRKFYAEPESYQRLLGYYRRERAWQQAEIDRRLH